MDALVAVAVAIIVTVLGVGLLRAGGPRNAIAGRLPPRWRWSALPLTCATSFSLFLVLRPLLLDQPRTPLWYVLGLVAVGALYEGSITLAYTVIEASRVLLAQSGGNRGLFVLVTVILMVLISVGFVFVMIGRAGAT